MVSIPIYAALLRRKERPNLLVYVCICCCYVVFVVSADLQEFLSCGPLLWVLGQGEFDKMVEVICPVCPELSGRQEKLVKELNFQAFVQKKESKCVTAGPLTT